MNNITLGKLLKNKLKENGYTQQSFVDKLKKSYGINISRSYIAKIINGDIIPPKAKLALMSKVLNIQFDDIMKISQMTKENKINVNLSIEVINKISYLSKLKPEYNNRKRDDIVKNILVKEIEKQYRNTKNIEEKYREIFNLYKDLPVLYKNSTTFIVSNSYFKDFFIPIEEALKEYIGNSSIYNILYLSNKELNKLDEYLNYSFNVLGLNHIHLVRYPINNMFIVNSISDTVVYADITKDKNLIIKTDTSPTTKKKLLEQFTNILYDSDTILYQNKNSNNIEEKEDIREKCKNEINKVLNTLSDKIRDEFIILDKLPSYREFLGHYETILSIPQKNDLMITIFLEREFDYISALEKNKSLINNYIEKNYGKIKIIVLSYNKLYELKYKHKELIYKLLKSANNNDNIEIYLYELDKNSFNNSDIKIEDVPAITDGEFFLINKIFNEQGILIADKYVTKENDDIISYYRDLFNNFIENESTCRRLIALNSTVEYMDSIKMLSYWLRFYKVAVNGSILINSFKKRKTRELYIINADTKEYFEKNIFKSGDRVNLVIDSDIDGYLTIINEIEEEKNTYCFCSDEYIPMNVPVKKGKNLIPDNNKNPIMLQANNREHNKIIAIVNEKPLNLNWVSDNNSRLKLLNKNDIKSFFQEIISNGNNSFKIYQSTFIIE